MPPEPLVGGAVRKAILMTLLASVSGSAAADWAKWVVVDRKETFAIYADIATIRKAGNTAQMWDLSDAKAGKVLGGVKQSLSSKMEREYDCSKQEMRMLYVSWYSGNMGGGEIIGSDANPGGWQPALLGTIGERLWKIACDVGGGRRF